MLLGLVAIPAVLIFGEPLLHRWPAILFPVVVVASIASVALKLFACPRCRGAFFAKHFFWGPYWPSSLFRRRCWHCGLAIGTPRDLVSPEAHRS